MNALMAELAPYILAGLFGLVGWYLRDNARQHQALVDAFKGIPATIANLEQKLEDKIDVSARLIEGDELGLCTRRWITTVSSFFRAGGRRPVRLSTPWDRISAQGERVLSVRGGDLIYPQTGDRITHSQRGTVPC
jgi:hypothetical protein